MLETKHIIAITGGVVLAIPLTITFIGFGTGGIVGGSVAAGIQSGIGNVIAGSSFAVIQSLGAKGVFLTISYIGGTASVVAYTKDIWGFSKKLVSKLSKAKSV